MALTPLPPRLPVQELPLRRPTIGRRSKSLVETASSPDFTLSGVRFELVVEFVIINTSGFSHAFTIATSKAKRRL